MLAKKNRLGKKGLNQLRTSNPRVIHSLLITIKFARSSEPESVFAAAVIVPARVSKKAVVRNRIRRKIYSFLQTHLSTLPATLRLLILVKRLPTEEEECELNSRLERILQQCIPI